MRNNFLLTLLLASAAQAAPGPWAQLAQADLDFVHQTLQENHPGAIDPQNPYFKQWMERGYAQAHASALKAGSLPDVKRVLARYVAGFADGHLALTFSQQSTQPQWPGIIMGRSGARYIVSALAQDWPVPLPAVGAELISCDDRTPDTLMNEDILPGLFNLTSLASVKNKYMSYFFLDDDLAPHQFARCVFAQDGERKEFSLKWSQIRQLDYAKRWEAANPKADKHSTITQVGPKAWWVHLPNFDPNPQAEVELKKLIADMPGLRAADLVVFDLRGNNGGNSQWGEDVLDSLYGKPFMLHRRALKGNHGYAEWRVSPANLKHVEEIAVNDVRLFGANSDVALEFGSLATRMRAALKNGQRFIRQDDGTPPPPVAPIAPPALSAARAILVTDSNCASSCLNGADDVLGLPDVRHFGQTTGADTVFMDVRKVELPSGLGRLYFGQKVDREALRGNNQPWVPSLQYDGQIGDTEKVRAWVLKNASAL